MSEYVPSEDESENESFSDENEQMDDHFEFVGEKPEDESENGSFSDENKQMGDPFEFVDGDSGNTVFYAVFMFTFFFLRILSF